ncbi:MAG: lytic transglycosylase domain-containing protein [Candidatus Margulisbacteria bacterium]|nr:lytic transglycosylase domain-containing protein [Candidatus Margulisiibacteriota bacterium]
MEYVVIVILAIFLLTSASQRDTRQPQKNIAVKPQSTTFQYKRPWGYENIDSWRLKEFIKKFQPSSQDYQIEIMANAIIKNAKLYDVDPKLIAGLIARESSFNSNAKSATGALGLGQIKPFNFADLGITDAFNPDQNIKGVAIMLKDLLDKWQGHTQQVEMALASYTEGYNGVKRNNSYKYETKLYVEAILKYRQDLS